MKSVLISACLLLAFAQFGSAVNVCGNDVSYKSALIPTCIGTDVGVLWPNLNDFNTYYQCYGEGNPVLKHCPTDTKFTYYFQKCTSCKNFLPCPDCEILKERTNVICSSDSGSTTQKPPVTKPTKDTTTAGETTATTAKTSTTKRPPIVPTPPSQGTTAEIPVPPMMVTPKPGVPTPPNQDVTPPSIPATPPYLTTMGSA